jgi:hypothetical protein
MRLIDLPPELFRPIIVQAIDAVGDREALSHRLVCSMSVRSAHETIF